MSNKPDRSVMLLPYFKVHDRLNFNSVLPKFIAKASTEQGMIRYGFSHCNDITVCRESYVDGDALAFHLEHVSAELGEALKYASITRLECHGPKNELEKVKPKLELLGCIFYELDAQAILGPKQ